MPKYKVLAKSFIDNHLLDEGAVIDYDGLPAENLQPIDAEGEAKVVIANAKRKQDMTDMIRNYQPPTGGLDQAALASAIALALRDVLQAPMSASAAEPRQRQRAAV